MGDLTDEQLDEIASGESIDMIRTPDRISMLAYEMVQEIRRRRAADLTDADRAVLQSARDMIYDCMPCGSEREVALLDRLIGGRDG